MRLIAALCAFLLALSTARADVDPALREDGVLYLQDNLPNRVIGTIKAPTTVYLRRDFGTPLASLFTGQKIEIVGVGAEGYLISGIYRNNSISGWIMPNNLPPDVDPGLFAQAKKIEAHRAQIAAAIANKEVLRGMTQDEVHQSMGDPDQTSSHTDASGTSQTWAYITYQNVQQTAWVPGYLGRPVLQTYTTRVPIGKLIVTFTGNMVSALEQSNSTPANGP